jgi:hypothetical protein
VRTDHQQLERVLIQNAVGKEAQQLAHAELVDLHASQIADFGFAGFRLADNGSNCLVKRGFFLPMQLLTARSKVGVTRMRISQTGTHQRALLGLRSGCRG